MRGQEVSVFPFSLPLSFLCRTHFSLGLLYPLSPPAWLCWSPVCTWLPLANPGLVPLCQLYLLSLWALLWFNFYRWFSFPHVLNKMLTVVRSLHPEHEVFTVIINISNNNSKSWVTDSRIKFFHNNSLVVFYFQNRVSLKSNVNYSLPWSVFPLPFAIATSIVLHLTRSEMVFLEVSPYLPMSA